MSFEDHIRKNLKNYPSEVDVEELWSQIEPEIPNERDRKRRIFIFFFFFIGLIAGITYTLPYSTNNGSEARLPISLEDTKYPIGVFDENSPGVRYYTTTHPNSNTIISSASENIPTASKAELGIDNSRAIRIKSNKENGNPRKKAFLEFKNPNTKQLPSFPINHELIEKELLEEEMEKVLISEVISEEEKINGNKFWLELEELPMITALVYEIEEKEEDLVENKEIVSTTKPKWTTQVGLQCGAGTVNDSYFSKDGNLIRYITRLNDRTLYSRSLDFNISLFITHKSGFFVKSGLNIQKIKSGINTIGLLFPQTINSNSTTADSQIKNESTPSTDRQVTNNPAPSQTTNTPSGLANNQYRTFYQTNFNLPISLGYHINMGKVTVGFESGILTNLVSNEKGSYYFHNHSMGDLSDHPLSPYKARLGMMITNGIHLDFALNDNLYFSLNGNHGFSPKPINDNDSPYHIKRSNYGFNAGIKFNLNK